MNPFTGTVFLLLTVFFLVGWEVAAAGMNCGGANKRLTYIFHRAPLSYRRSWTPILGMPLSSSLSTSDNVSTVRRPQVIIVAGPTAVGKSDVAARLQDSIIVSADSVQVYRGVQIGANKPTKEERAITPHLLVDLVDSSNSQYNAADWTRDALYCIQKLGRFHKDASSLVEPPRDADSQQRQNIIDQEIVQAKRLRNMDPDQSVTPVVVGGTMMYLQWLVHGRPDAMRPTSTAIAKAMARIQQFQDQDDWEGALLNVKTMGDKYDEQAQKLSARDFYRLRRIMEVAFTVQELKAKDDNDGNDSDDILNNLYSGQREGGLLSLDHCDVRCFFLCPHDRMTHSKIVDERCEQMLQKGLLRETTDLALAGALPDMARRAIGYRQTLEYLGRENPQDNDLEAFLQYVKDFTTATRQYSKRQMQWFRKDPDFCFIPVEMSQDKETRVAGAAREIHRQCQLPRTEFDQQERLNPNGISAETRNQNEKQGKGMKVYQLERKVFLDDSEPLRQVLKEADLCTNQFQSKRLKIETVE